MRKRYPEPTYEKEYREAIQKRSQRIPVYKDFCVGDPVYMWKTLEAIIWRDRPNHVEVIFEDSYHSGLIEKYCFDDNVKRRSICNKNIIKK